MKAFSLAATRRPAIVGVVALAMVFVTVLPGRAQTALDYTHPGPYLGLGVTGGLEKFNGGSGSAFGDSAGFTFRGGYRLAPYFAVEGVRVYG